MNSMPVVRFLFWFVFLEVSGCPAGGGVFKANPQLGAYGAKVRQYFWASLRVLGTSQCNVKEADCCCAMPILIFLVARSNPLSELEKCLICGRWIIYPNRCFMAFRTMHKNCGRQRSSISHKKSFFFAHVASYVSLRHIVKYPGKKNPESKTRFQNSPRNLTEARSHAIRATTLYKRDVCTSNV